ncbi:MAG: hypothetical protein JJ974_01795 [Phycisphaerales bacterium]|nr:hypothetical protein [Phycisphaerales bacterium]
MQIWIDNTQLSDAPDIGEAIEQARLHAENAGRLIVDILVDGQPAPDELYGDTPETLGPIEELRFTTADTRSMVNESINTAIDSIELLKADQAQCAQQIRSGELGDSMETLRSILEGWQAIRDMADQITQITNLDIQSVQIGSEHGSEIVQSLSTALSEVRETLQNEDWSSLGDVIEYDLEELATKWSALLGALIVDTLPRSGPSTSEPPS